MERKGEETTANFGDYFKKSFVVLLIEGRCEEEIATSWVNTL